MTSHRTVTLCALLLPSLMLASCTSQEGGKGSSVDHSVDPARDTASSPDPTDTSSPGDTDSGSTPSDSGLDSGGGVETGGGSETGGGGEETPEGLVFTCADATVATVQNVLANTFADRSYYPDGYHTGEGGDECVCTFRLSGLGKAAATGVTVWMPMEGFAKTNWAPKDEVPLEDDRPRAVALLSGADAPVPWIGVGAPSIDWGTEATGTSVNSATEPLTWFGFHVDPDDDDTAAYYIDPVGDVTIDGTYEVHLSMVNSATTGEALSSCAAFSGNEEADSAGSPGDPDRALHFRIDIAAGGGAAAPAPVRFPITPASPLTCTTGAVASTEVWLIPTDNGVSLPVATGGDARILGAAVRRVTVTDWRGAERLQLRSGDGRLIELNPGQPSLDLTAAPLLLDTTTWRAKRDREGAFSPPRLRLEHICIPGSDGAPIPTPTPTPTQPNNGAGAQDLRWALSWGDVSDWLAVATGGLRPEQLGLQAAARGWPVFALHLEGRPEGQTSFLKVEVDGVGLVHTFALHRTGEVYRLRQAGDLGLLSAELRVTRESAELRTEAGRIDTASGALDLRPSTLRLQVRHAQP